MSCLFSRSIGALHYSADQYGDASLFVLLGLQIGAMNWIEGALGQVVLAKDEIPRLVQNALVSIG